MMNTTLDLKRKIMNRVYILYIIRKLKTPIAIEVLVFILTSFTLTYMISIQRIITSSPHDIEGLYHFWISAFIGTKLVVKALLLIIISISVVFVKKTTSYMYVSTNRLLARA